MKVRRIKVLATLAGLAMILSSCDLLYSYMDPYGLEQDPLTGPPTSTTYGKGSVTLELTQGDATQTITLGTVSPNSTLESMFGAMVSWENEGGWTVMVNGYDPEMMGEIVMPGVTAGDLTINRITDNEMWTAGSYSSWGTGNGCAVDIWEMSETKFAGRVNCQNLRWTDGMHPSFDAPAYIDGQEPFNVTVTFEAEPSNAPPGTAS